MTIQQAVTRVRRTDPGTSFESAVMATDLAGDHIERIQAAMRFAGRPLGAEEIGDITGLQPYAVRKRLPEMKAAGLADVAEGERKTRGGRTERLWQLTQGAQQ